MSKLKFVVAIFLLLAAAGCRKEIYVPVEKMTVIRDSVARSVQRTDTVIIADSILMLQRGDTIIKEVWRRRDRVSLLHDTVSIIRCDTVREDRPVILRNLSAREKKRSLLPLIVAALGVGVLVLRFVRNKTRGRSN